MIYIIVNIILGTVLFYSVFRCSYTDFNGVGNNERREQGNEADLQRLLARSATDDEPMQLPENISLPIGTFEQMDEFEEHLGDEATIHLF